MKTIAFEGIDGCGKTTQCTLLYEKFRENPSICLYRYTDRDNFWGRVLKKAYDTSSRSILRYLGKPKTIQELLYAFSARANLKKAGASENSTILADRSIVTAYASHLNILPEWYINLIEPKLIPDTVVYLDLNPFEGLQRIATRENKYRDEDLESMIEFRNAYLQILYKKRPKSLEKTKFHFIDSRGTIDSVHREIMGKLEHELTYVPELARS